jgi:signal transduction histidine kinase
LANTKIMVVEDEGIVALDIQSKLEGRGYEVPAVVHTGEDAVEQAGATRPDLILMDIQLEGDMDGIAAAEQIRDLYQIPVVYLTAYSDDSTLERAKISEPFGYLLKPFEENKLHTTIEIALYKHQIDREKERLEAQLHQARRMEAVGRLTAGIAYNFTNLLQGIQGALDLTLNRAPDELKPLLESADYDAQRAGQLVRQLMLFYQSQQGEHEAVDVGQVAGNAADTCRQIFARKYSQTVDVRVLADADLPAVQGDRAQLRQCLTALCARAGDALDCADRVDRRIELRISSTSVPESASPAAAQVDGHHLRIDVIDRGEPIADDALEQVFEPFLSTQDPSQSTGLGLAMVYAIVREHRGWVECSSTLEEGTIFSIYLPSATSTGLRPAATAAGSPPRAAMEFQNGDDASTLSGTEKVLVVADVDRYRKIHAETLEDNGYQVLVGLDVADALTIFEFEKDDLAAVVVDLTTGELSPHDLISQLLRIKPSARILVLTGHRTDTGAWDGATAVLDKPFRARHLLGAVRHVIGS